MLFDRLIQIRDPEPHSGPLNMALDETLMAGAREPLVRVYRWQRRAVSFGYFGRYSVVADAWPDHEIVRRMTGGGIVEHGEDITYTLVVPAAIPLAQHSARESYRAIHSAIAAWMAERGITASLAASPENGGTGVCFESPAEADLIANGRKLAGAAQRRTCHGLLYQGSVRGIPDTLRAELPSAFSAHIEQRDFTASELAAAQSLAAAKYADRAWTERV